MCSNCGAAALREWLVPKQKREQMIAAVATTRIYSLDSSAYNSTTRVGLTRDELSEKGDAVLDRAIELLLKEQGRNR